MIADRLAHATSAFGLDEIVARALERRGRYLELPGTTAKLLTLVDSNMKPLEMLLLSDDEFKNLVQKRIARGVGRSMIPCLSCGGSLTTRVGHLTSAHQGSDLGLFAM